MLNKLQMVLDNINPRLRFNNGLGEFRGVKFYIVEDTTLTGGRRVVRHEYPLRENAMTEDLGLALREYAFTAVVMGNNYFSLRDQLITALETPEPGELDHPYWGKKQIQVETYTVRESCSAQGVAFFSVTFVPVATIPAPVISDIGAIDTESVNNSVIDDFVNGWETVTENIKNVTDKINAVETVINSVVNGVRGITSTSGATGLLGSVLGLRGSINQLIDSPDKLIGDISGIISGMKRTGSPPATSRAIQKTVTQIKNSTPATVPARPLQKTLVTATTVLLATTLVSVIIDAVKTTTREKNNRNPSQPDFLLPQLVETRQDTQNTIVDLDAMLSDLMTESSDFGWFKTATAIRVFRAETLQQLTHYGSQLPNTHKITTTATEPALVVLYRETGDVQQINRFLRRNGVRHPSFIIGGTMVEVIND